MRSWTTWRPGAVDLAWGIFVVAMNAQMWIDLDNLTWPYHLIWVSLILLYGFRMWPPRVLIPLLVIISVSTAACFITAYVKGVTPLDELTEIPLMPLIVAIGAWHAWSRREAQRRVEQLAALESSRLDRQREFLRDTSHAIRTPVTIARGHVDLLAMTIDDDTAREDIEVVLHQMDRLSHLAERLLSIEQLQTTEALDRERVDVQTFTEEIGRRWAVSAPRSWVVDPQPAGAVRADERRLEEAVDALVENALRFTGDGGVVRLSCRREGDHAVIEVADDGPGIPAEDQAMVFDRFFHRHPRGAEPGTGLGLALVQAVATAHGGRASAGTAPEGGALLTLRLPLTGRPAGAPAAAVAATAVAASA